MSRHVYDIVVIGTGAGGGTMAYALSQTPARILVLERGDFVPQEADNWSPEAVWQQLRYRTTEEWLDAQGRPFRPYAHYNVGGNTKFWGSVLYRLRPDDFRAVEHADGVSPAWPIDYATLEPWYERAERLYHVHGEAGVDPTEGPRGPFPRPAVPHQGRMAAVVADLARSGLHPSPLPLGLRDGCILCSTCNSFACRLHAKSESDVCCLRPAMRHANVTVWTRALASRLVTDPAGRRVEAVEVRRDGETLRVAAGIVIVACGAVNSAALLLRSASSAHPRGLANASGLVGRRYMAHLATMISGFDPLRRNDTVFQKTVGINDYYVAGAHGPYPLGQIQSQGRTDAVTLRTQAPAYARWIPMWAWRRWAAHAVDWLVMSEDLPDPDNRVLVDDGGRIQLRYVPNNLGPHRELVRRTKRLLRRMGFLPVQHSLGSRNTTHQCGTLCFGFDPAASVLDPFCRAHEVPNLFAVDASFFPSSAAVNPALTIIAQALRVADHIRTTDMRLGTPAAEGVAGAR